MKFPSLDADDVIKGNIELSQYNSLLTLFIAVGASLCLIAVVWGCGLCARREVSGSRSPVQSVRHKYAGSDSGGWAGGYDAGGHGVHGGGAHVGHAGRSGDGGHDGGSHSGQGGHDGGAHAGHFGYAGYDGAGHSGHGGHGGDGGCGGGNC